MTHTITIETQDDKDFALIKGLVQRLGLRMKETHKQTELNEYEQKRLLQKVAGSWLGDESGDELAAMIQNARHDSPRDVEL